MGKNRNYAPTVLFNPLVQNFLLLPSNWDIGNSFTYLHLARSFFHVYCLANIFSLVLTFPELRIEAPPLSTVQCKCI